MKLFYIYKNKTIIICILSIIFSINATYAMNKQNNSSTQMLSNSELYCKQMRGIRAELIENNPKISVEHPIHLLADARCFTAEENLYFAAIKQAQKQLGEPSPWFDNKMQQVTTDVELECKANKFKNDELTTCIQNKYFEKKNSYEAQQISDIVTYLAKRQKLAESLFNSCSRSMIDKITLLPQAIQLPIALHLPTNRSITELSLQDNQHDNDWLLSLQYRSYQEDLREILQHQCPEEMIYWVTLDQSFDRANLYRRK
jgi:hypothetical protein